MTNGKRIGEVRRLYEVLEHLEGRVGPKRRLSECSGKLNWPKGGVYFFFEQGEERSDSGVGPRIVRVGTHALTATSNTTLWNRLSQHRGTLESGGGNHRGSIFRLIVGTALARRDHDDSFTNWGKGSNASAQIRQGEVELERRVTAYIGAMPFLWIGVDDPEGRVLRGTVERGVIGLLSNYEFDTAFDPPSANWLGHWSDRERVRRSGLWNQNHVDEGYDPTFLDQLERLITKPDVKR